MTFAPRQLGYLDLSRRDPVTVVEMLRDMRAAHAARVNYRRNAIKLAGWAREAEVEGWSEIANEYRRLSRIARNAERAEGLMPAHVNPAAAGSSGESDLGRAR